MTEYAGPPGAQDFPGSSAAASESAGVSFGDIFRALWNSKWLILACALVCLLIAGVYVYLKAPVYQANGTLRIDPTRSDSLGLSDPSVGATNSLETEMAILQSDQVVIAALNSLTPEQFEAFSGLDKSKMNFDSKEGRLPRTEEELIGAFKGSLAVKAVEGTQLIEISFQDNDPEVAATAVNHVVDAYVRINFDSRYNSVSQVRSWLSSQMNDLRERAATAQRKLADFQERNNLLGTDASNNTTMDTLRSLNQRSAEAEADRIVKEAQMRAAQTGDPAILATLMSDAHLGALQSDEANLYAQYTQLSAKFGPAYPPLKDVQQQLSEVRAQIAKDVSIISGRLNQDYQAAVRTEDMLRKAYTDETAKAYALNRTQAEYNVLVAEGTSSRDLYDTLQFKLQQASVDAGLNAINTMVVDRARPPIVPIAPKKTLILAFGLLLGLAGGVGAALLRESLTDDIRHVPQIESQAGMVTLASVPHGTSPMIALREPRSRGAEAYRTLRNAVLLASPNQTSRTVLVTSPLPKEGKTVTVINYAIVLAQKGSRVLVVDADLRRPTLHEHFGVPNTGGVGDVLDGGEQPHIVAPLPDLPTLSFLPAGKKIAFPSEALGSAQFRSMLEGFEKQFDFVVLDSAPILTVSDSLPLASWVGTILLVVRAGMTPLKALQRARAMLLRAHARVSGVVLNDLTHIDDESGFYGKDGHGYYN